MRATLALFLGSLGCAHVEASRPEIAEAPRLARVEAAPHAIPSSEVGRDTEGIESIDLAMPGDARILSSARNAGQGRETWTLAESGPRRVLRLRQEDQKNVRTAAWVGTAKKDGKDVRIDLRLVERSGPLQFAPEHATATCARETICEDGKPKHKVAAMLCVFRNDEAPEEEIAYFAPGPGVDFPLGPCPHYEPTAPERLMKRPLMPRMNDDRGF